MRTRLALTAIISACLLPPAATAQHYTQFMVYDLDGDGRAEVACKTADGTVDGAVRGQRARSWRRQSPDGTGRDAGADSERRREGPRSSIQPSACS